MSFKTLTSLPTSYFGNFITGQCGAKNIQIHHWSVELVIIGVTVVGNLVRFTRKYVKLSPRSKRSATHYDAVSVEVDITCQVVPGDCKVRPGIKWNFSTINRPPFSNAVAMAPKCQPITNDDKVKLPWTLPIIIDCLCSRLCLFYPAANGKTPAVKMNCWGSSEWILNKMRSRAAWTPSFDKLQWFAKATLKKKIIRRYIPHLASCIFNNLWIRLSYDVKSYADRGECYPPRPKAEVNNSLNSTSA